MTFSDQYFKLTADITINRNVLRSDGSLSYSTSGFEQWIPIGLNTGTPFCGVFDGEGHTISGLYLCDAGKYSQEAGLFGYFSGTVKNLIVKDSYIMGSGSTGGIVAYAKPFRSAKDYNPLIENCVNYATIDTKNNGGGIVGYIQRNTTVNKCINYGKVNAPSYFCGGIAGSGKDEGIYSFSYVMNCVNYGTITGKFGGFGITLLQHAKIENCANFGNIVVIEERETSDSSCGGVGYLSRSNNCVNYGHVPDNGYGIQQNYKDSYNTVREGTITNCYYLETSCKKGYLKGTVSNCVSMTSMQMKQQSFLNELNQNAKFLGSDYCKWKFGSDGYPTLEFVE